MNLRLVDTRRSWYSMNNEIKKKYRKANSKRRFRMKKQYLYSNILIAFMGI